MDDILSSIPQRPPFLFVDTIIERGPQSIRTSKHLTGNESFFEGHFPGNPIMPGVLLCEAVFQTGALLMAGLGDHGLGVVSRIHNTKFRQIVKPGDTLIIDVSLSEHIDNAYLMKGRIRVNEKTVMSTEFTCATLRN